MDGGTSVPGDPRALGSGPGAMMGGATAGAETLGTGMVTGREASTTQGPSRPAYCAANWLVPTLGSARRTGSMGDENGMDGRPTTGAPVDATTHGPSRPANWVANIVAPEVEGSSGRDAGASDETGSAVRRDCGAASETNPGVAAATRVGAGRTEPI